MTLYTTAIILLFLFFFSSVRALNLTKEWVELRILNHLRAIMSAEPKVLTLQITVQIRSGSVWTRTPAGTRGEFSCTLKPYLYTWKFPQLREKF